MSTPMPKSVDPFNKIAEKADQESSATRGAGAAKGASASVAVVVEQGADPSADIRDALETPFEEPPEPASASFEEPKVDEFGTGHGI